MPITQREVIAFLSTPRAYGRRRGRIERIDTHISIVFLVGVRAYKLKRDVTFPYLDYSTLERRRAACEREVRLNRRTAPDVYRAAVAVTLERDGRLALGGLGEPVEWLVEMVRFDGRALLDRLADQQRFPVDLAHELGGTIARFHDHALPRRDYGGEAGIRRVIDGNLAEMLEDRSGTLDPRKCATLHDRSSALVDRAALLLDARRLHGLVRQCHGDLHLHNVFLADGVPTIFDAIEFNDDFACIDVMYDFAFLLMDLLHRGLRPHANAALNGYFEVRPDPAGLSLLPLVLSCRAAVRAKVSLAEARVQRDAEAEARRRRDARAYLELAQAVLTPARPVLVAIGGLSGSGKSTLARRLAPAVGGAPGAVVLRTDVIRKHLFGVPESRRLPDSAYDAETTARVYARAVHLAEACLRAGQAVLLDAVFGDVRHRQAVERLAAEAGVPFCGLWLDVPYRTAARRLHARRGDASDAGIRVLQQQARKDLGPVHWVRVDAGGGADQVALNARQVLAAAEQEPVAVADVP
ncbi:MAG TPA: AAA family ATPase [Vicinamibacterales bacterium]|nr:AAA family ATPase [Vicinamibacterales bacterium]